MLFIEKVDIIPNIEIFTDEKFITHYFNTRKFANNFENEILESNI